jgi:hypothetical protein
MSQLARVKITRGKKDFHLTLNGALSDQILLAYLSALLTGKPLGEELIDSEVVIISSYLDGHFFPLNSGDLFQITDDKGTREYEYHNGNKITLKQTFNADFDTSEFAEEEQPSLIDSMNQQGLTFSNSNIQFGNYTYTTLDETDIDTGFGDK